MINTFLYDLPIVKNKSIGSKIFGDIQLSGILAFQTGFPSTVNVIVIGLAVSGRLDSIRPNYISGQNVSLSGSDRSTSRFFNTAAFSLPATGTYGNLEGTRSSDLG